jgi:signal transduction histidine kinase
MEADVHENNDKLADTQRALMNMLEDIEVERVNTERAKTLLESVNKELEAFSYSVSHDLRAPLRAISGFVEAVMEDCAPRLDAEGRRYLGLIQDNAHKMGHDRRSLAFSTGPPATTKSDRHGAWPRPSTSWRHSPRRGSHASPRPPWGEALRQVLINLPSNATVHQDQRSLDRVRLRPDQGRAYYVKDNGWGSTCSTRTGSSASFSVCTGARSSREPGSVSRTSTASSLGTAAECGRRGR